LAQIPPPLSRFFAGAARWLGTSRLRISLELLGATLLSAAFALRFGFSYGTDNQTSYLLGALHRFHPELLRNDWLTTQTSPYHPAFQFVGWLLFALDDSGWSFAIANFASILAGGLLLYWICRKFVPQRYAFLTYLLCMTITMITETDSIAVTYFFEYIFQPSNLGTLGWLAAIGFWCGGRWWATGIALAAGGLMHGNFLLLSFPVFGLAHVLLGRDGLARRLLRTLGPSAVVLLLFLPILVRTATSENSEMAHVILMQIRSPHHYWPERFQGDFVPFASWQALGLGLGVPFLRRRSRAGWRLAALFLSIALPIWIATVLTTAVFIPQVSQLFVWRIAPFSDVLAQLLACAGIARLLMRPAGRRQYSLVPWTTALLGAGFLATYYGFVRQPAIPKFLLWGVAALAAAQIVAWGRHRVERWWPADSLRRTTRILVPLVLVFLAGTLWTRFAADPVRNFRARSNLIQGLDANEQGLYDWIRAHTPVDALFLTPPGLERFRLHAQRAIVVDWKSPPLAPDELVEWYRRLCNVSGNPEVTSLNAAEAGYRRMDAERLATLVQEYGVQFVVLSGPVPPALRTYRRVFSNGPYSVLQLSG